MTNIMYGRDDLMVPNVKKQIITMYEKWTRI